MLRSANIVNVVGGPPKESIELAPYVVAVVKHTYRFHIVRPNWRAFGHLADCNIVGFEKFGMCLH